MSAVVRIPVGTNMEKFHGGIQTESDLQARWDALKLGDLKGKRVLDVGAAEGWFSKKCNDAGAHVVAVEPVRNVELLIDCKERWQTFHALPFDDPGEVNNESLFDECGDFDIILMLRVLYHMKIPQLALARAGWMLKPGGILYLENWFDDPESDDMYMKMYEDEPDGWRLAPSKMCVYKLLQKYGFEHIINIFSYQKGQRQIWRATKNTE